MPLTMRDLGTRIAQLTSPVQQAEAVAYLAAAYGTDTPLIALDTAQARAHLRWPDGDPEAYDEALRYEWDLEGFTTRFFPHLCTAAFNPLHHDIFAQHRARQTTAPTGQVVPTRGHQEATAAPRGSAKTTIKGFIKPLHALLYQHERYIVIAAADLDLARDKVKALRDELGDNAELVRVFGPQQTATWRMTDFITRTGCRVRAISPHTKVRGLLWRGYRPTLILLDDAEDPEAVLTDLRRARLLTWLQNDIAKLGTADTNIDVIGTVLHPESLLAHLLTNPGYQRHFYRAVLHFAEGQEAWDLWAQWRTFVLDLEDQDRLAHAHQFYLAHEEAMLTGTAVLWPENPTQTYEALMLDRVIYGEAAFFQERQNEPLADTRYLFDMDAAAYCTPAPDSVTRADGRVVYYLDILDVGAFYDPALGRRKDCAACVVVLRDRWGYEYVVDAYCTNTEPPEVQYDAITDLLWRWQVPVIGVEANGFQSLIPDALRQKVAARAQAERVAWHVDVLPVTHTRNKILRIKTLEPYVINGWLQFSRRLPVPYLRQFREFLPIEDASRDDAPDATEGALRVVRGIYDRRSPK
jgi:predicted phage terminase large subunit-like protein